MVTQNSIFWFYIDFCPCSPSNSWKSLSTPVRKLYDLLHDVQAWMRAHGIEVQRTKLVITTVKTVRRRDSFLTAIFFLKWPERRRILCTEEKGKEILHCSSDTREKSEENARRLMVKFPRQLLVLVWTAFIRFRKFSIAECISTKNGAWRLFGWLFRMSWW